MARQYDLARLIRDLDREPPRALRKAREAVAEEAPVVRESWRARMRARSQYGHIPYLPSAITVTIRGGLDPEAEIGPDKLRTQGPLGNLLEFGSKNNRPHKDGYRALQGREDSLAARIETIAKGLL